MHSGAISSSIANLADLTRLEAKVLAPAFYP